MKGARCTANLRHQQQICATRMHMMPLNGRTIYMQDKAALQTNLKAQLIKAQPLPSILS